MKKAILKNQCLVFVVVLLFFYACKKKKIEPGNTNFNTITIKQGNKKQLLEDFKIINLDKDNFSIEFYNKKLTEEVPNRALMALSLNKNEFTCYNLGDSLKQHLFFKRYRSFAYEVPTKTIVISNDTLIGNMSLFYKDASERSVNLVNEYTNDFMQLQMNVESFYVEDEKINIKDIDIKMLYGVFLIDRNLNTVIDENELFRFAINFEKTDEKYNANFMETPPCNLFKVEVETDEYSDMKEWIEVSICDYKGKQAPSFYELYDFKDFNGDGKEDVIINQGECGTGGCIYSIYLNNYENYYDEVFEDYLKNIEYKKEENGTLSIISSEAGWVDESDRIYVNILKFKEEKLKYEIDSTYTYKMD